MRDFIVYVRDNDNALRTYKISAFNSHHAMQMANVLYPNWTVVDCIDERMSVVNH